MINWNEPQTIIFGIFATLAVISAFLVILHKNPVTSAIFLVLTFFSLAGIYAVMDAIFIATMQVLVYAGAIMVLIVFVLMLLNLREETHKQIWEKPFKKIVIFLFVGIYAFLLFGVFYNGELIIKAHTLGYSSNSYNYPLSESVSAKGNIAAVGASTFLDYLLSFELISVLLLAAVIGAVILAKKDFGKQL
ncbi:MAG: NADH-quinone oxidoreductase subunit J [Leptospiraceae bacterium]|nr:NADH-quinone oxidoreductase subunit J [Leptospiraceae bacterium]MCK6380488.1 NADH-quinone oxidoreductase subunit J [Leptospiraceae bacterium]NUM42153.1 NADH-quinone oxidoreductase subunit J [Leptospiraceae bacterium]